jgi:hypothetical protein
MIKYLRLEYFEEKYLFIYSFIQSFIDLLRNIHTGFYGIRYILMCVCVCVRVSAKWHDISNVVLVLELFNDSF